MSGEDAFGCIYNCVGSLRALTLSSPAFMMSEDGSRLRLSSLLSLWLFISVSVLSQRALTCLLALTFGWGEIAARIAFGCCVFIRG